jgi:hypothetical protein
MHDLEFSMLSESILCDPNEKPWWRNAISRAKIILCVSQQVNSKEHQFNSSKHLMYSSPAEWCGTGGRRKIEEFAHEIYKKTMDAA